MAQRDCSFCAIFLSQFVGFKVTAYMQEVECNSKGVDYPGGPEGAVIAPEFAEKAAYEYAQANACIPRGQD